MSDVSLIYTLLKDYHAITPDLKALRIPCDCGQPQPCAATEARRHRATGWFNHVATLYLRGLIDEKTLGIVASRAAAQLWVEHVAPLDQAVRVARGGNPDEPPITERFWRDYAAGHIWRAMLIAPQTATAQGTVQ